MQIETKFNLKDKVYYVSSGGCEIIILCSTCNDTKEVTIKDEKFKCPKCTQRHASRYRTRYYIVGCSMIGKISIEHEIVMGNCNFDSNETITSKRKEIKTKISYMLADTGIGSGTCWPEDSLFGTKKEAEDYCSVENDKCIETEKRLGLV